MFIGSIYTPSPILSAPSDRSDFPPGSLRLHLPSPEGNSESSEKSEYIKKLR